MKRPVRVKWLMAKRILPFLFFLMLPTFFGVQMIPSVEATSYYYVTVRTLGLPPNMAVRVYAGGVMMGTIHGGEALTFNTTYGPTITVDSHTPDGYPYYGYPYYSYPGPLWGSYGNQGVAFYCRSSSTSVPSYSPSPPYAPLSSHILTFRYDPLFFLYIKSDRGNPQGTGWYLAGTWAYLSISTTADEGGGTRYRFEKWTGGNFRDDARAVTNLVYVDAPRVIEAVWVTQHQLTIDAIHGETVGAGWYDRGQSATFSVTPQISEGESTRYLFSGWTGDFSGTSFTGTITMDTPKTIRATWKTQYRLSIDTNGGQIDKTTQWIDSGSTISVKAISPSSIVEKKTRLVFAGWEGDSTTAKPDIAVLMDGPKTLKSSWTRQYYLTIDGGRGTTIGEGWYDANNVAEFSVPSAVSMEPPLGYLGGKYTFARWTGDITSSSPNDSIIMNSAHTISALWGSDYTTPTLIMAALVGIAKVFLVTAVKGTVKRPSFKIPKILREKD